MRFFLLFIIAGIFSISIGVGQKLPNEMWHPGYIVLESEDTLSGNLQYDFESNLLQFSADDRVRTFTSRNILFFSFKCQFFERKRSIYSLPYELKGRVKTPVFFEILEEGSITLMAREYVILENNSRFGNPMYRTSSGFGGREILTYDYFLLTNDGIIHRYSEKKKDLLGFFGRYEQKVKEYISENRLKVDKQRDLVSIMKYYNGLASSR